jgi:Fic family protein
VPGLYRTGEEKRQLESRNGAIQFLAALNYIDECAGTLRSGPVMIAGVDHHPPNHAEIPALVEGMCLYVNQNWTRSPIHLASYLMWRLNWVHPFFGGNGRTARAVSYLVLCARLGFRIPGTPTIPESIVAERGPYYWALQAADTAWADGRIDLSKMEDLMAGLLAKQLLAVHRQATGNPDQL